MQSKYEIFSAIVSGLYHDIQRIERVEMAKYGLKGPQAQCLMVMRRYPEGITAARLCQVCERDKGAISRTVAELEAAGLVVCQERYGVRYRAPLVLTEAGLEAANNVSEVAARAVELAGTGLEDPQREVFYEVLGTIAQNLHTISREGLKDKEETKV